MKTVNRVLRPIAISLLLCIAAVSARADGIQYTYDASGNRTTLRLITLRGGDDGSRRDADPLRHNLTLRRITIYPNPTHGQFSVEIGNADTMENASITIYSATGSIIYYNDEPRDCNDIDLSLHGNGMYLLVIRVDGETSTWKIIKI